MRLDVARIRLQRVPVFVSPDRGLTLSHDAIEVRLELSGEVETKSLRPSHETGGERHVGRPTASMRRFHAHILCTKIPARQTEVHTPNNPSRTAERSHSGNVVLQKEASMSRDPEWAAYRARTGLLLPRLRRASAQSTSHAAGAAAPEPQPQAGRAAP